MKVFFLGTGAAEGIPALFCECQICLDAKRRGGKDVRTRSTILIDDAVKIDFPPDTLAHVHAYPSFHLSRLKHLFFTHSDDDHFAAPELQYLSPIFAPCRTAPLDVYATEKVIGKIQSVSEQFFEPPPLRLHSLAPFVSENVDNFRIIPVEANHNSNETCLNYLVTEIETGKTLFYGSDTGWFSEATWQFLKNVEIDTVILECGKGDSASTYEGHLNVNETILIRTNLLECGSISENTPFYLTHLAHTGMLLHDDMVERVAPFNMQVAFDGLEIML